MAIRDEGEPIIANDDAKVEVVVVAGVDNIDKPTLGMAVDPAGLTM